MRLGEHINVTVDQHDVVSVLLGELAHSTSVVGQVTVLLLSLLGVPLDPVNKREDGEDETVGGNLPPIGYLFPQPEPARQRWDLTQLVFQVGRAKAALMLDL
eukprot:1497345-Rhodomonas_salina.1